jgi:hypothetical protein
MYLFFAWRIVRVLLGLDMDARIGNQFWKARTKHGRDKIFASAELLRDACIEYFEWVEANPLYEAKLTSYQGVNKIEAVPKMRAMTIGGICLFLGITQTTWIEWRKQNDFSEVISWADAIIRDQKFTGAAADLLNPNIIARDLGLADKSEITGKDGSPLIPRIVDDV